MLFSIINMVNDVKTWVRSQMSGADPERNLTGFQPLIIIAYTWPGIHVYIYMVVFSGI